MAERKFVKKKKKKVRVKREYRQTIMIVGISSFVGSNLAGFLKQHYRIVGTYYKNVINIDGVTTVALDILNKEACEKLVYIFKPDYVIYCVGLTSLRICDKLPKLAEALNNAGVFNLTAATERFNVKFIYISTPFVFSGEEDEYTEKDSPMPVSVLGASVSSSEFYVQKSCLNYLIFRCSKFFGRGYDFRNLTFLEFIEYNFYRNIAFSCDDRIKTGYFDVLLFAKIVHILLQEEVSNRMFQISSQDICTQYEFARTYARLRGLDESLITKKNQRFPLDETKFISSSFKGRYNFFMNLDNIETQLRIPLPSIEKMLQDYLELLGMTNSNKSVSGAKGVKYV